MSREFDDNDSTQLFKADYYEEKTKYAKQMPQSSDYQPKPNYQQPVPPQPNYQPQPNFQQPVPPQPNYQPQPNFQQPVPPQPNYQPQPNFQQPVPPHKNKKKKKKKNNTTIIMIIIILILIITVIILSILFFSKNSDSDDPDKQVSTTVASTEAAIPDETAPPTEATESKELVKVPDVRGSDYRKAEITLRNAGLRTNTVFEFSSSINQNIVISQSIKADEEVEKNTLIEIKVSQGVSQVKTVKVPSLKGMTCEQASEKLKKMNLIPIIMYQASSSVAENVVIEQDIATGVECYEGTGITIFISSGQNGETTYSTFAKGKVITKETDLNMRSKPSSDSDIIMTIPKDSVVEIISPAEDWFKVRFSGRFGYVSSDYIEVIQ